MENVNERSPLRGGNGVCLAALRCMTPGHLLFLLGFAATFHNFISVKADAIWRLQLSRDFVSAEVLD